MQLVDRHHVQCRYSSGLPRTLEVMCPHCRQRALFHSKPWQEHGLRLVAAEAPCERCEAVVQLVQLLDDGGKPLDEGLYMSPAPGERRPMAGSAHLAGMSAPLGRTYESALRLFNNGDWGAAALTLRHLLTGLAPELLPKDKRELPLQRQLAALATDVDLARPLQDIGRLLGAEGPFEREFNDEAAMGQATAGQLLDTVEQLLAYLVVLPAVVAELRERVDSAPVPLPLRRAAARPGA